MNFKERFLKAIAEVFGKDKKASEIKSVEDREKVASKYEELFNSKLEDDHKAYQDTLKKAEQFDSVFNIIEENEQSSSAGSSGNSNTGGDDDGKTNTTTTKKTDKTETTEEKGNNLNQKVSEILKENNTLKKENEETKKKVSEITKKLETVSKETANDNPKLENVKINIVGQPHSKTHLFGIEHSIFSLDKRWNQVMVNPSLVKTDEDSAEDSFPAFQKEFSAFGRTISKRIKYLHENGLLNPDKLNAGLDVGYSDLTNAGIGEQFIVRRQDALIARIISLPNVYGIFPRRFGVQDRELITNAFLGEFSQPHQLGEVWKGTVDLQPEVGYVDDVMFKTLFNSMKWIERQYLGYLNREGSDPIKWSMIEWTVLQIATKLTMEQYKRRVVGIYSKPVSGEPGHYLYGSTGFVYTLLRFVNEWKLQPFSDGGLATYTSSNIVSVVNSFVAKVRENKEDFNEMDYTLMLNANHRQWYKDNYRTTYGTDNDMAGVNDMTIQDTDVKITWVPNMGNLKLITMAKPGNFQALEYIAGEMLNIKFQPDMETVKSWSTWKEGFSPSFVNKEFTSLATLAASNYKHQEVFINKPTADFTADDTTPSVAGNIWFLTVANTGATAITDLDDAEEGKGYLIEVGSLTNQPTIAASGVFSELTAAWNPTALGDNILLTYDATNDKFYELERTVGGTRTINKLKQPNLVGNGGR